MSASSHLCRFGRARVRSCPKSCRDNGHQEPTFGANVRIRTERRPLDIRRRIVAHSHRVFCFFHRTSPPGDQRTSVRVRSQQEDFPDTGVERLLPPCYPVKNSAFSTSANLLILLERAKGFEPSPPTLARCARPPGPAASVLEGKAQRKPAVSGIHG